MKRRVGMRMILALLFLVGVPPGAAADTSETVPKSPGDVRFVVYYFHGKFRCPTCLKIEQLSARTVRESFGEHIGRGFLEWKAVDIDEPNNKHFSAEFDLSSPTLAVARFEGGQMRAFKKLDKVWQLVEGDERTFESYVLDEIDRFVWKRFEPHLKNP
jgi:hypothetical protein